MRAGNPVQMTGKHQLVVSVLVVIFIILCLMGKNMGFRIPGFSASHLPLLLYNQNVHLIRKA
jgi:hypothetical protein